MYSHFWGRNVYKTNIKVKNLMVKYKKNIGNINII